MSVELKVKSKHLAAEARIIRAEERRLKAQRKTTELNSLCSHRKGVLRCEARATYLARAFLRGVPRTKVEQFHKDRNAPNYPVDAILRMVNRYGPKTEREELYAWLNVH